MQKIRERLQRLNKPGARTLILGEGDKNEDIDQAFVESKSYGYGPGVAQLLPGGESNTPHRLGEMYDTTAAGVGRLLGDREVTLFVHGFNVDAEEAFKWQRRLPGYLEQAGYKELVLGWYWPGKPLGGGAGFPMSELYQAPNAAKTFGRDIRGFLGSRSSDARTNILAHSLGNRVVMQGLHSLEGTNNKVHNLVMYHAAVESDSLEAGMNWTDFGASGRYLFGVVDNISVAAAPQDWITGGLFDYGHSLGWKGDSRWLPGMSLSPLYTTHGNKALGQVGVSGALGDELKTQYGSTFEQFGVNVPGWWETTLSTGDWMLATHSPPMAFDFQHIRDEMRKIVGALNK